MRFLQIEWHNHERLRNAWDIEREEMKQKIAKQEGANKKLKRMNEILDKHIKILEKALKEERAKNKAAFEGDKFLSEEESSKTVTVHKSDANFGKPALDSRSALAPPLASIACRLTLPQLRAKRTRPSSTWTLPPTPKKMVSWRSLGDT